MYHSRKYKVNENFFGKWSADMAYVLGFWFADGYMRKEKSYRIIFISNDVDILHYMRQEMGSTHPIRKRITDNTYEISICSQNLYNQLQKRGGLRAKSRKITFPDVPYRYFRDFLRGYFDGDGSVFIVNYISTKNKKPRKELRSNFTSGSKKFLLKLMLILNQRLGLAKKTLGSYNDGHSLKLGYATADTKKLLKFMYYKGFNLGLGRKAEFVKYS